MTTRNNLTTTAASDDKPKRRRRAAHVSIRHTEAGAHTLCGKLIARQWATPVKVDEDGVPLSVEYYPCTACENIRRLEKSMEGHWSKFLVPADMALVMADSWEVKK